MNGIDRIISKINSDSRERCESIIAKAKLECDGIGAKANANAEKIEAQAVEAAEAQAQSIIAAAASGAAQLTRQTVLAAKVGLINEAIEKLLENMKSLPDEKYFAYLIKLACENSMKGSCTAKLCEKDLQRLPPEFEKSLISALSEKGAECVLSKEPADIDSGIILDYGDIEVNCSFDAIIEAQSDSLKVKAGEILFRAVTE